MGIVVQASCMQAASAPRISARCSVPWAFPCSRGCRARCGMTKWRSSQRVGHDRLTNSTTEELCQKLALLFCLEFISVLGRLGVCTVGAHVQLRRDAAERVTESASSQHDPLIVKHMP